MATYTTNYNLKKPAPTDFYDVADFNDNANKIDAALQGLKAKLGTITLTYSNWVSLSPAVGEYNYKYEYNLTGITANDVFNGSVTLATEEAAQDCGFAQRSDTSSNKVTFYAKDSPSSNIIIDYDYIQGV